MTENQHQSPNRTPSHPAKSTQIPQSEQATPEELITNLDNLNPADILRLQRVLGNQAVLQLLRDKKSSDNDNTLVQRAPIDTTFGTFTDEQYDAVDTGDTRGVDIKLTFDPNSRVNAEKFGMVQSVKSYKGDEPIVLDPRDEGRMVEDGDAAGTKIDNHTGRDNPLYNAPTLGDGKDLGDTPDTDNPGKDVGSGDDDALYKLGHHYHDSTGALKAENAEMFDAPRLTDVPPNSGQEFETTVLATEGSDKDAYYGSVRWGWQTDAEGNYTKLDFEKISDAIPSDNFIAAAKQWNQFKYDSKVAPPDAQGNTVVTTTMKIAVDGVDFFIGPGTPLEVDVNGQVIGGTLLVTLKEPIFLVDGTYYWMGWVPTANIKDGILTTQETLERDGKPFTVAPGAGLEVTESVSGDKTLVMVKNGIITSADVSHRIGWVDDIDLFGRETKDLPIPDIGDAIWSWLKSWETLKDEGDE